ncbi:hypothetical protein [Streptomyces cinereoruber]|uniref:hypothetical protein n=1 Tax=Streptomyces cinereoruber TaxID=67260 RepID=UPI003398F053
MTLLSIRVYKVDARSGERQQVSQRDWSADTLPFDPLFTSQWPPCLCRKCGGEGTPGELPRR